MPSLPLDKTMKKVFAEFNHGRWVAICPKCLAKEGIQSAMDVKPGDIFVCPEEYPDITATALISHPRIKGAFTSVSDEFLREETRRQAIADGNSYQIEFPKDAQEIVKELRKRPRHARNWSPGTTVAELKSENERILKHA
jgi:hypothetical protein